MNTQTDAPLLLRNLDEKTFEERYQADRFTATVLTSRLRYIVKYMCTDLLKTAFSVILRDWYDFAATISGPASINYASPAQSDSLLNFIGTMGDAVRNTAEEYGPENLRPGDVLMANDPYRTGTHVNDTLFSRPVFYEGEIVAYVNMQAHLLDLGGVVPAGFSATKKNVYENGLVFGPTLLYQNDKPVKSTWNLIFDNTRYGDLMLPDMQTIYTDLLLGERLILETIERYGLAAVHGAMRYGCDVEAEQMATAIAEVPDGDYFGEGMVDADAIDDAEEYTVRAKVSIRGSRAEVDFSGSSRQARSSINAGWLDTKTAVAIALKLLFAPAQPMTSAATRPVDIVLPEGTFFSAMPPDGAIFMYFEPNGAVYQAVLHALAGPLGANAVGGDNGGVQLHNANGLLPDGTPWQSASQCGGEHGPWPASKVGDGDSYSIVYTGNGIDPPTETIEQDAPVILTRKEIAIDTGGPGYHRGGAAIRRDSFWLTEAEHFSSAMHLKSVTGFGIHGGGDAPNGGVWLFPPDVAAPGGKLEVIGTEPADHKVAEPVAGVLDPETQAPDRDGQYYYYARVPVRQTEPKSMFRYLTNGGGGWGDPFTREPERVLEDVRNEYVSIEGARRDYGVVVVGDPHWDPEGLTIDAEATAHLRAEPRG